MKILSVEKIRELDAYTIKHEPIKSIDLMERASKAFVQWLVAKVTSDKRVLVVAGTGNNGGDGIAVARMLLEKGYEVQVLIIGDHKSGSEDFRINCKKLTIKPSFYDSEKSISEVDIIIDAIFGSGLSRPVEGEYARLIEKINNSSAEVASIDMPSGLFADKSTPGKIIVNADATVSFQLPKLAFMMPETYSYVGNWHTVDIGLSEEYISNQQSDFEYITINQVKEFIKSSEKFDHKGKNGHALVITGSYGKMGAAVIATNAALRSGVGLVSVQVPKSGNDIIQSTCPEAMTLPDMNEYVISKMDQNENDAIAIGPGIGKDPLTVKALKEFLIQIENPIILDADALNIISENREMMELIPSNSILTPHPKEFERLLGEGWNNDFERLQKQIDLSKRINCIIVLKGAHTSISLPNGKVYFNSTGNTGMAKGGSGDVLTGMLAGILAQGYSSEQSAILAVFLHGLAGDFASNEIGEIAMKSSDIIDFIPEAYSHLY